MTPAELDMLADKISERLREPMISSAIPHDVGAMLREAGKHGQWMHKMIIQLHNGYGIQAEWVVNTDGSLTLRLMNINGQYFWHGSFRVPESGDH